MTENPSQGAFHLDIDKVSQELRVRPEILKRLIISFSKSLTEKILNLKQALDLNDVTKARALLHELKGTSGNLRVTDVYQAVDVLHVAVKTSESPEKIHDYFIALQRCCQEFQDYIGRLGG